ncbi:hypothetical protein ABN763_13885 [Spongiivirga sp. MCCC 1A20706]|uniref:hypothetical protein n=1 Tax=Spongiivirga sp. MCCC 1A20706 TaxID=3160963 RepID=UPI00397744BD
MSKKEIYIGNSKVISDTKEISGKLVQFENESYYKISNYDAMRSFFMSVVSASNHWMFISSNGGLSAGRQNSKSALFPYYTDDKITESSKITGNKTVLHVLKNGKTFLWEPFSEKYLGIYTIHRNLYKNVFGNKLVFEEINDDLGLTFRYHWNSSELFGFVKKSNLINNTNENVLITVLDGIQNIMPYGVDPNLQNSGSNLVDAYKRNELQASIGLGIYGLSAIIVDKAEPSEALKATTAWSTGLKNAKYLVSSLQLNNFRKGHDVSQEIDIKAEKGAYFVCADIELGAGNQKDWLIAAEVNQTMVDINKISKRLKNQDRLFADVEADINLGTEQLLKLNAATDAIQLTADKLGNTRHFANALFNIMRGGIFDNNYTIERQDFIRYIKKANINVYQEKKQDFAQLPEIFDLNYIKKQIASDSDVDFQRLVREYLPLKFSRRHGDPSRPWNQFSINTTAQDGSKLLDYEGNWRDIFQNWEALAYSYPEFIEGMIFKFLNATTFDGYNPYRVTKGGFDWETIEPDDPWSYIGYWGDHQIIYLLKFLEFIEAHYPEKLGGYFGKSMFVYANVPYKIKDYNAIQENPKDTIIFDEEQHKAIDIERVRIGADGALLKDSEGGIYHVNLLEKLLATVLAKVSNFIPEGGIWMNTQRPEWNDANNALVGNGVSMVTLYYLRRFLHFFEGLVERTSQENFRLSKELITFFDSSRKTLIKNQSIIQKSISNKDRKMVMDGLGEAGSTFRNDIYQNGFSGRLSTLTKDDLLQFIGLALKFIDHSVDANKRSDSLYHAYNLMTIENDTEVSISYLSEMLEGQVAVLSSGYITAKESLKVLDALKNSALFRPDQYSYILYPNKELPRFVDKNNIPLKKIEGIDLLQRLLQNGNSQIIEKDVDGNYHFNGSFNNAESLKNALDLLEDDDYGQLIEKDKASLLELFEDTFNHKAFTGRSGTFFGYEGLGSIYWHMVSKLLLAVQETCLRAINNNEEEETIGRLLEHYYEINEGIGVHKSPELYGAFPTDPYSHTPGGKGAQQPGMTGQVKEDILSRFGELGIFVANGQLYFNPSLLRREEFLKRSGTFSYIDLRGNRREIALKNGELAFTYCQVPMVYRLSSKAFIEVLFQDKTSLILEGLSLDKKISKKLFSRNEEIDRINISLIK